VDTIFYNACFCQNILFQARCYLLNFSLLVSAISLILISTFHCELKMDELISGIVDFYFQPPLPMELLYMLRKLSFVREFFVFTSPFLHFYFQIIAFVSPVFTIMLMKSRCLGIIMGIAIIKIAIYLSTILECLTIIDPVQYSSKDEFGIRFIFNFGSILYVLLILSIISCIKLSRRWNM
jgi:hypothetical protein